MSHQRAVAQQPVVSRHGAGKRIGGQVLVVTFSLLWTLFAICGTIALWDYSSRPGKSGATTLYWPESSKMSRDTNGFTMVLFVHPRCPCSRATLRELEILQSRVGERVRTITAFIKPASVEPNWNDTDLWQSAKSLPNTQVIIDPGGTEAKLFGASTSGHTMLFDRQGNCVFSGGITSSRGHQGDNIGRSSIENTVIASAAAKTECSVYGCSLWRTP